MRIDRSVIEFMKTILLLTAFAAGSTGCATMIAGGHTELHISSPTPSAEVSVRSRMTDADQVFSGPLPADVTVSKKQEYVVTVSAPGYKTRTFVVSKGFQGWTVANLVWVIPLFWGVGVAVDAMSGAIWTLDPETIHAPLSPAPTAPVTTSSTPAYGTFPQD